MGHSPSHQTGGQAADNQAGSTTEYMGTRKTRFTVHGVPVDISEDCVGAFFAKYGQVEGVNAVTSKSSIATVM